MKKLLSILLTLVLVFSMVACTSENDDPMAPAGGDVEENVVTVSTIGELFDAIADNTTIMVEPGYYNITDYLTNDAGGDYTDWEAGHANLLVEEVYDGLQMEISNAKNLKIIGKGSTAEDTEIVIEPRYANVFTFYNCENITMENLCIGHTEVGECAGDVLLFQYCDGVELVNMDLYGCGVNGITALECGDIDVSESCIHDCSWAALDIENCVGSLLFTDCSFKNNGWGVCSDNNYSLIKFHNCSFGQNESNSVAFNEDFELTDCDVMEPTENPEI